MQVILGPFLYEVVTTVFQRSMKSAQAYFRASESRQVDKPSSWQPVSLFCRVDVFFWSFSFQGSFVWADRIYVATVWSHGQCVSIDEFYFYNHWSRSLGLAQGRISSLLVNLASMVSRNMRFL